MGNLGLLAHAQGLVFRVYVISLRHRQRTRLRGFHAAGELHPLEAPSGLAAARRLVATFGGGRIFSSLHACRRGRGHSSPPPPLPPPPRGPAFFSPRGF